MQNKECPCGRNQGFDPCCDMCDSYVHDPDTGWGGYTNHFTDKHYNSDEEESKDPIWGLDDDTDEDSWGY